MKKARGNITFILQKRMERTPTSKCSVAMLQKRNLHCLSLSLPVMIQFHPLYLNTTGCPRTRLFLALEPILGCHIGKLTSIPMLRATLVYRICLTRPMG